MLFSEIFKKYNHHLKIQLDDDAKEFNFYNNNVVFGSNGSGKTTISNYLENNDNFFVVNQNNYSDFMKSNSRTSAKGKRIKIEPYKTEIENIENQIKILESDIKNSFINYQNSILEIPTDRKSSYLNDIFSKKPNKANLFISKEEIDLFEKITEEITNIDLNFIKTHINTLFKLEEKDKEIQDYLNVINSNFFELGLRLIENNDVCPLCDCKVENLYDKVQSKLNKAKSIYEEYKNNLFSNNSYQVKEIESKINSFIILKRLFFEKNDKTSDPIEIYKKFTDCIFITRDYDQLIEKQSILEEIQKDKENLVKNKNEIIKNLETSIEINKTFLETKIGVKITIKNCVIEVDLNKEGIKHFSAGELNFLFLFIKLLEFAGSTKKILILDDPINSNDSIYQYNLIYSICYLFNDTIKEKKFTIFSHNSEIFTLFNNQFSRIILKNKYFMDKNEEKNVKIYKLKTDDLNLSSITKIANKNSHFLSKSDWIVINALIQREKYNEINPINIDDGFIQIKNEPSKVVYEEISNFFHFTKDEIIICDDNYVIKNNQYFQDYYNRYKEIWNEKINELTIEEILITRVLLFISIRYLIENSIYKILFKWNNEKLQEFLNSISLAQKIRLISDINTFKEQIQTNISDIKIEINKLKVLLNESSHSHSIKFPIIAKSLDIKNELNYSVILFSKINKILE